MSHQHPSASTSRAALRCLVAWLVCVAILAADTAPGVAPPLAPTAAAAPRDTPLRVGERLAYSLSWGMFTVGMLTLQVAGPAEAAGQPALHFVMEARTNSFGDKIYRVRNRSDSWLSPDMARTVAFTQRQEEGRTKRNLVLAFDWPGRQVTRHSDDRARRPVALEADTFDPLGMLFALRALADFTQPSFSAPVTDGKRLSHGEVTIVKRERIKIQGKTWDAILVEPDMRGVGGVFEKSQGAKLQVWFSDDARRLPLKISSSVAVGRFTAELLSDTPGEEPLTLAPHRPLPPPTPAAPAAPATTPGP